LKNGDMKAYVLFRLAGLLSRSTSRRFAYWISLRLADAYFFLDRGGRDAVLANLRQVYAYKGERPSDTELKRVARRMFQLFAKYLVDFFRFSRLGEEDLKRLVTVEHPEHLARASGAGKGVIAITAHLGNWELGGAAVASMGYPVNAVVLRQPSAKLNEFFQKHRRSRGLKIIPLGHALRNLLEALRRGEFVALVADRDYSRRDDFAELCGAPACLPRGPAWIAYKTGAPILPCFMVRQDDDTFRLCFYPPIVPDGTMTREDLQRRICAVLEDAICSTPSQWFMFERVWNGRNYAQAEAEAAEAVQGEGAARRTGPDGGL
jgi:lauroyl/myristoyl acyltransferase